MHKMAGGTAKTERIKPASKAGISLTWKAVIAGVMPQQITAKAAKT
jgi:hypothetical protein